MTYPAPCDRYTRGFLVGIRTRLMKISNLVASATAQTTPLRSHGMTCSAVPGPSWRKCNQRQKRNLLLIGGTGTGKTHPAIALGRNAARQGK